MNYQYHLEVYLRYPILYIALLGLSLSAKPSKGGQRTFFLGLWDHNIGKYCSLWPVDLPSYIPVTQPGCGGNTGLVCPQPSWSR